MANDVRVYKISTGEEIIGKLVSDDLAKGIITIEDVRVVQMVPTGPGQVGVGIVPFSPSCVDGKIELLRSAIIANIEHTKDLEDAYLQQTSGIQLVSAGSVPTR